MPLGFERLNERSQRPNALINFIKPLDGPDRALSEDYLNRIAAQCYPVMKANHISVMTLAEHEHNNEFLGRNFNAGEYIELVLKDKSGRWLGFKHVQMVMMHELAHCKQMNHSKYFWQVRNGYANEMYDLWKKSYLGEGVWGRGQSLTTGLFVMERELTTGDVPEHLCGGTFRRRGRKRKKGGSNQQAEGQRPSYAERQQQRIQKKFGKHGDGNALGEDELVRGALEQGQRHQGKPRVAGSKRGRELRAQAALARFEVGKTVQQREQGLVTNDSDAEWSDSETEDESSVVLDNGFIKVCGEQDEEDDGGAQNELQELQAITQQANNVEVIERPTGRHREPSTSSTESERSMTPIIPAGFTESNKTDTSKSSIAEPRSMKTTVHLTTPSSAKRASTSASASAITSTSTSAALPATSLGSCPICSLDNESASLLCMACGHVLRPKLVKGSWRCKSATCEGSAYLNPGDVGRCGVCGDAKKATLVGNTAPGLLSADILRWD